LETLPEYDSKNVDRRAVVRLIFHLRVAILSQILAAIVCPSVCLSVCHTPVLCQNG